MKKSFFFVIALCATFLLVACGAPVVQEPLPTATPQNETVSTVQASVAPIPSVSPLPTPTEAATPESTPTPAPTPTPEPAYSAIPLPEEMRAMWISFIEWQQIDISTEESMRAAANRIFGHCAQLGINTVIVAVHAFNDALYESEYFPWSHLISGQQGEEAAYDPLAVLLSEAHAFGLRVEAWVNPYRVQHPEHGPETLSEDNPAVQNPSWIREQGGLWLDPGLPEVRGLVTACVTELVERYEVDGIHFDDYFYPEGATEAFDTETYATYGGEMELADWRRQNVNEMIHGVYTAVKAANQSVSFGVSPQGNNQNNYNQQYCDINLWMAEPGYADYIMPQLYWGFQYTSPTSGDMAAFPNKLVEWSGYPRHESVRLYAGLGAYRIGEGDGSPGTAEEWKSGHNIADMVRLLRQTDGFSGFALFHYVSLFPLSVSDPYYALAASETAALAAEIAEPATVGDGQDS